MATIAFRDSENLLNGMDLDNNESKELTVPCMIMKSIMSRPTFDDLPLGKDDPPFSAWGLYGKDDQLGTPNLLTPEVVVEAAKEIKTGVRVGLALPLNVPFPATHNRYFKHEIIHKAPRAVHDDVVHLNTQCSSQWDGFRHYGYQKEKVFYNGHSPEDFQTSEGFLLNGIQSWCQRGIAARGVLLDYVAWAKKKGIEYSVFEAHAIPVSHLKACAKEQDVDLKWGDILLIRNGWKETYLAFSQEERDAFPSRQPVRLAGIELSVEMARFLWETGFSAAGSDVSGLEMWPIDPNDPNSGVNGLHLHEVMLSGWGMPIGELLDLDELSEECKRQGRYSFFLTSMPLNIPGGVASPANLLAIF